MMFAQHLPAPKCYNPPHLWAKEQGMGGSLVFCNRGRVARQRCDASRRHDEGCYGSVIAFA